MIVLRFTSKKEKRFEREIKSIKISSEKTISSIKEIFKDGINSDDFKIRIWAKLIYFLFISTFSQKRKRRIQTI